MTDIIFKTNITQPASNVANLNFVDGVIKLNANSTIGFNAECSFSTFSVTSVMSKIELNLAASFTELVPLDVFIPESSKGIIPAIGFHIVNQGDGDPYFEQAKLLCHFNKLLGNGGFYDEKNRKRGLAYDNSYPKRFFDGDSKITYIDDSDSFEGNVVSTYLHRHFIFGDYIEPVNLHYSKLLTTDEQVFYSYKSAVQTNFTSHGSDLTLKINLNGTIKTYQEWFDYFSELENRCAPYMLLNGALIKIADYTGDYGRNLSVRGKDWCLEARFKITGANLLSETNSANSFDLFSTKDILLNVSIKYKINYKINDGISVLDSFELGKISFTLNPSASNLNFIQWDVTSAIDNNFSDVKLCCTDGQYELFFDGIKIPVTLNNFYDYYKARISNGSIFLDNFKKTNENYHKFGLFIWNELPYYQSANDVVFRGAFHQQDYFFGIDRFYVTVNSVEVIFDGVTFVENSFTIDVPFDLIFNTSLRCRNYEIYVSILNNRFIIEVEQYDFVYLDINGVDIRISGNPTQDIERRLVTTISREFIATVKNWDSKIYDKNYSNLINVQGRYLDEMRFTIGDVRIKESLYATEPFPNFIENRIAIEAKFDLSAVYQFGANNFIRFEPKVAFKDFTKKPKNTIPTTPIAIEFSNLSLIELSPAFLLSKINFLDGINEISIAGNSSFVKALSMVINVELSVASNSTFALVMPVLTCDPLFENVVLLMPCDSSPLIDIIGHTVTCGSSASIENKKAMFNSKSLSIVNDINSLVEVSSSDFGITKDSIFCIEFWFYPTSSTDYVSIMQFGSKYVDKDGASTRYNWQFMTSAGNVAFGIGNTKTPTTYGTTATSTNKFNLNQWNHVKATNEKCFLNGVEFGVGYISGALASLCNFLITDVLTIGNKRWWNSQYPNLKISDIRITIGNNRSNEKVPPTTAYQRVSCIKHEIIPIQFVSNSSVEFLASAGMKFYPPITFNQESEITIFIDLTLKQIKTELVYLPAENRSKASTGFVDKLLEGNGVASIFDNGTIEFYTGNRPYSANHAVTGTFLGELKNIKFGTPINRIIRKDESQTWLLTAINSGRIGWFRIKADAASDYGQDSIREVRLDGEAGVDAAAIDFSVKAGDYYHVQDFAVMWGNG